jgi:DNA repair protein RecO (recombination protein O)
MITNKARIIVLHRTNYGESDKIATVLTSEGQKLSIIAKGVRKPKSKLVCAVELFCVCDITTVTGKSSLATVTSAKMHKQYTSFLNDLDKVNFAYDIIKYVYKTTDNNLEPAFFTALSSALKSLHNEMSLPLVSLVAWSHLLQLQGSGLQLKKQTSGKPFKEGLKYAFDFENGGFVESVTGVFEPEHVKLVQLAQRHSAEQLTVALNSSQYAADLQPVIKQFVEITHQQIY